MISKLFIDFLTIYYINSSNGIGAEGAKGLGTALQQLTHL